MKNRAGIILWCKSKRMLLLIKRIKGKKTYWVVPGGGVETGESYEEAAKRELAEETGIFAESIKEFVTLNIDGVTEKYFVYAVPDTCSVTICGEERKRQSEYNRYIPKWISLDELCGISLLPSQLKEHCSEYFI